MTTTNHAPLTGATSRALPAVEHQPRERPVPCRECLRPTWNYDAVCDKHREKT